MTKTLYFGYGTGYVFSDNRENIHEVAAKKAAEDGEIIEIEEIEEIKINFTDKLNNIRLFGDGRIYDEFATNVDVDSVIDVIWAIKCYEDYSCDMVREGLEAVGAIVEDLDIDVLEF